MISDATGNYCINPDNVAAVTEDPEGVFGSIIYTIHPDAVIQLRIPYITATHDVNNPRSGEVMKRLPR